MISVYSFCSAIVFYNICLGIVFLLRRKKSFLSRYTTWVLSFLTLLGLIRLFTPIDFDAAYVVRSETILPFIADAVNIRLGGSGLSLGQAILLIWALGSAALAVRDVYQELQFARQRKNYSYVYNEQALRIAASFGEYTVKTSPQVLGPFVAGIFKPVIYLPCMELSEEEMRFILRHEIQHIRSHDALKKLLFLAIEAVFWWNPLAHISMSEIDAILEMQCDAKMTAGMSRDEVYDYMCSLLAVMKQMCPDRMETSASASAFLKKQPDIVQRIEVMQSRTSHKSRIRPFLLCCVFTLVFTLSYLVIFQPYIPAPEQQVSGMLEISPDNAYLEFEDGVYSLYVDGQFLGNPGEEELNYPPLDKIQIK